MHAGFEGFLPGKADGYCVEAYKTNPGICYAAYESSSPELFGANAYPNRPRKKNSLPLSGVDIG
jgi:hypothetical protein